MSNSILLDGQYARGVYVGRAVISYPFQNNGDRTAIVISRQWRIRESSFVSGAVGIERDPVYSDAFLVLESDPQPTGIGDLLQVVRTFARVPRTQTEPASIVVPKPEIPGDQTFPKVIGDYLLTQPDTTLPRFDAYYRKTVTSDTGVPSFYPTGGTYTLTFDGDTTGALNYNDNAATVEAALDALASVTDRGGVSVSGSYNSAGGLAVTFADYAQITIDSSALSGTGTKIQAESNTNGGYSQVVGTSFQPSLSTYSVAADDPPSDNYIVAGTATVSGAPYSFAFLLQGLNDFGNPYNIGGSTGYYRLTVNGSTTADIALQATFSEIAAALNLLGIGTFSVSGFPGTGETSATQAFGFVRATVTLESNAPTSGTFTVTVGANTTGSLNYNDGAATVEAALDGLASVIARGGCSVTGTLKNGFVITFENPAITATSSLTPTGASAVPVIPDGTLRKVQNIAFTSPLSVRDIYIANHAILAGGVLFLKSGSSYYYPVSNYTVIDANTLRLSVSASDSWASVSTITEAGHRSKAGYQPGSVRVIGSRVTNFYLPGITSGITTAADIPIPTSAASSTDMLLAILSGTSALNVDVGELERWRGPILSLTASQVSAANL